MNSAVCVASSLPSCHRQQLAVKVISKQEPVSYIARSEKVSRKFLYQQKDIAQNALNQAFARQEKEEEVLYHLPVTRNWIFQLILALIFICRSSYRGVVELLRDLFDYTISIGTIHNRLEEAVPVARKVNKSVDLSPINVASLDELFHSNTPILTGVDNQSSYCFLLQEAEHRDEDTWGWYLLEAIEQGLDPNYTIADAGKGIRAAHQAVWEEKVCQGDVWHIFDQCEKLCRSLAKKAQGATTQREKLQVQIEKTNLGSISSPLSAKLTEALKNEQKLLKLASDVQILVFWLRLDILSLAGPSWSERKFQIPLSCVQEVCLLMKKPLSTNTYWQKWNQLYQKLSHKFWKIKQAVELALKSTPRASSLVENLNSRLRNYFHLRKHLGAEYLELLQFFLNHRTFIESRKPERIGKSPTELMTGEKHPHWLEMLGFEKFQRA